MKLNKRNAFSTLEIIASIFVIAVIFFVCVTPMMQNRIKNDNVSLLKKSYAELFQALQMAVGENGDISRWGFTGKFEDRKIIEQKIVPHLMLSENCLDKAGKCVTLRNYRTLGNKYTTENLSQYPAFTLSNGSSVIFEFLHSCRNTDNVCANVYIDVNGSQKPNIFGHDLFVFVMENSNSILLPYNNKLTADELLNDKIEGCSKKAITAKNCAAYIYKNNWKITNDYEW